MKAERARNRIAIHLTAEEVYAVQAGRRVGDRVGATVPDATVEVLPLSFFGQDESGEHRYSDDRLARGLEAPIRGNLFSNGDLQVIVPDIALCDVRISHVKLPRDKIETPGSQERDIDLIRHQIPEQGVIVYLGGSLKVVDVDSYYREVDE